MTMKERLGASLCPQWSVVLSFRTTAIAAIKIQPWGCLNNSHIWSQGGGYHSTVTWWRYENLLWNSYHQKRFSGVIADARSKRLNPKENMNSSPSQIIKMQGSYLNKPWKSCLMYYFKHEQQCFIRYKDTRRSRVSLGLIKHALRMF